VGKNGLERSQRRDILRSALEQAVLKDAENLPPLSCGRLQRLAYVIAFEANTHKTNKRADYTTAVSDWVEDLEWLRVNFYIGNCDFPWRPIHS
jgi:hypothetical protein